MEEQLVLYNEDKTGFIRLDEIGMVLAAKKGSEELYSITAYPKGAWSFGGRGAGGTKALTIFRNLTLEKAKTEVKLIAERLVRCT